MVANILYAAKVWRLYIEGILNCSRRLSDHRHGMPSSAILRGWWTVSTRGGKTVECKFPNVLVHAGMGQGDNRSGPIPVNNPVSTAGPPPIHAQNGQRIGLRLIDGPDWIDYQRKGSMGQLTTDVCGAYVGAYSLNPRLESHSWKLSVVATRSPIPNGHPDVLHYVVDIAHAADPRQMGNDIAPHPLDGNHDLVNRDRELGRNR
ncbi:hypothetical protein [Arthrobacter sp. NA-172]|uniref:hypothetical protein n=1 Tax=Arthrobacter sp. NA-172 TaxID=3367524 RepID=UPI0037543FE7